jgi:hypothetical protein
MTNESMMLSEAAVATGLTREMAFAEMARGAFGTAAKVGQHWLLSAARVREYAARRQRARPLTK